MKLLFVHDHKFRLIDGNYYSTGGLDNSVLKRYTDLFDDVIVLSRVIKEEKVGDRYSLVNDSKVKIIASQKLPSDEIKRLVKSADKVIVRMPCFNGLKVLPLCSKFSKLYMIEVVACPWDSFWNYDWRGKIIAPAIYFLNKKYIKKSPYVLYVTTEFLQKRYPAKGIQVGCSDVCLTEFDETVLEKRKQIIDSEKDYVNLGTLAAIDVKYKGQARVIKAMGILKKNGITNINYHLAGNGDKTYLTEIAKKNGVENQVLFDGGIPHEKINAWFDKIDIYIQPSKQEGLPRALVEAMSNALPCIGAKTGGIPELLDKEYIFKNDFGDIKKLCAIIKSYKKESLKKQAVVNFEKAKKYDKSLLDKKRTDFLRDFRNK